MSRDELACTSTSDRFYRVLDEIGNHRVLLPNWIWFEKVRTFSFKFFQVRFGSKSDQSSLSPHSACFTYLTLAPCRGASNSNCRPARKWDLTRFHRTRGGRCVLGQRCPRCPITASGSKLTRLERGQGNNTCTSAQLWRASFCLL